MRVSAFYENIRAGAEHDGISMAEAVTALRGAGLQGVYVGYDSTVRYAEELAGVLAKTGAELTGLHAWINFDPGPTAARRVIDQAARLGTDHVLIVPVCAGNDPETLLAGMGDAVRYGAEKGVKIFMEDLDQADSPYNSVAGLRMFLDRLPGLFCCFDTGNWIMRQEDEADAFRQFQTRTRALHLKDRAKAPMHPDDDGKKILDGTLRYPAPVGQGYIRMAEILRQAGDLPLIVELYGYSPAHMLEGIRESVAWVRGQA